MYLMYLCAGDLSVCVLYKVALVLRVSPPGLLCVRLERHRGGADRAQTF